MYESFFGLARRPFAATPDPGCFVPVETARESLEKLVRCVEIGQGIGILTASAGMGKSLLCAKLIDQLAGSFMPVFLANASFPTRRSLLQAILYELGHPYIRMAEQELRLELTTAAKTARDESGGVLLVVDEAHLLSSLLLEEIRTITNLAEAGEPLARVILSGQLLLEEKLATGGLDALNQRIACQVTLQPLSQRESIEYIRTRIKSVAGDVSDVFTTEALELIARASDGVPRCLNQLCDHSLLLGYASDVKPVGAEAVRDALEDLRQLPLRWNEPAPPRQPAEPDANPAAGSPSVVDSRHDAGWSSRPSGSRSDELAGAKPEIVDTPGDQAATAFRSIEIGHEPTPASGEPVASGPAVNRPQPADDSYADASIEQSPQDPPSAVFELGSGVALNPCSADENEIAGCRPGRTDGSVHPGSLTAPTDESIPVGSNHAEESFADGADEISVELPGKEYFDTYRVIEPADSRSCDPDTDMLDFEEEIIEDRYAQLDAGLVRNENPRRPTRPQPQAAVTASTGDSPTREDNSIAGTDPPKPHDATLSASTGVANATGNSAVASSWPGAGDPDPVQLIDDVAPLLDQELQLETSSLEAFDSLSDLDMPSQLIGFPVEPPDQLQNPQDDESLQLGVVILDDWLESSSHESPATASESAAILPSGEFGDGTAASLDRQYLPPQGDGSSAPLSETQESRGVQEIAATQRFDVVQPDADLSENAGNAPGKPGGMAAGSQQNPSDTAPPDSSRPHGRYDQLFSDLRRRASRPA